MADNEEGSQNMRTKNLKEVGDLFSEAFTIYKERFKHLVGILLIFILAMVPVWIVIGGRIVAEQFFGVTGYGLSIVNVIFLFLGLGAAVLSIYINISAKAALFLYFKRLKKASKIKDLFHEGRTKYFWPLFVVSILVFLFVFLWSLLLIIPGLIFAVYYSFAGWALIFEGHKGRKALQRSKELVKGYWWAVFGRYVALYLAIFLVLLLFGMVAAVTPGEAFQAGISTIKQIVSLLITPLFFAYSYLLYKDLLEIKGFKKPDRSA